jgi:NAD(P)H-hydrate repair Nnr-like enzyme with NAD(P)H-hydrate epimerase domain
MGEFLSEAQPGGNGGNGLLRAANLSNDRRSQQPIRLQKICKIKRQSQRQLLRLTA